ncbi:MAG: hypothetical protein QXU74_01815 [Candidatus Aenigmatarchaeota archaeon]
MERPFVLLFLLVLVIFISGCIGGGEEKPSGVGLSSTLTSDTKKVMASSPVTFVLTIKNLASETAEDIKVQLLNLTEWRVENEIQELKELKPNDLYKFSWVAYAPSQNKTFIATANVFYYMRTKANIKLRVYDNEYLNTLNQEERNKIKEKSALLSSMMSKNTQIGVQINLKQPFILTRYRETFPFVLEIKNVGFGEVYSDTSNYPPPERYKEYVRFEFNSNSTLQCDFDDGELVKLSNKSKNIVCRLVITKDDIKNYADFSINFTIGYTYLDKARTKIEVV